MPSMSKGLPLHLTLEFFLGRLLVRRICKATSQFVLCATVGSYFPPSPLVKQETLCSCLLLQIRPRAQEYSPSPSSSPIPPSPTPLFPCLRWTRVPPPLCELPSSYAASLEESGGIASFSLNCIFVKCQAVHPAR